MAEGFNPAEFAAFKAQSANGGAPLAIRVRPNNRPVVVEEAPTGDEEAFDPAEFETFRRQNLGASDTAVAAYTADVLSGDPERARPAIMREQGRQAGAQAGALTAAAVGLRQGASANFDDEVAGLSRASGLPDWTPPIIAAPVGAARVGLDTLGVTSGQASQDYADQRDYARGFQEAARDAHPVANIGGEVVGGFALPVSRLKQGASIAESAKHAAAFGAGYGALAGAGAGEGGTDRLAHAAVGAGIGGTLGAGLGAVAGRFAPATGEAPAAPIAEAADRLAETTGAPVRIPQAAASDSFLTRQAGAIARNVPFAGDPLVKAGATALDDLGQAARNVAAGYGAPGRALAGDAARADMVRAGASAGPTPEAVDAVVGDQAARRLAALGQAAPGAADRADIGGRVVADFDRFRSQVLPARADATFGEVNRALAGDEIGLTATRDAIDGINRRLQQSGSGIGPGDDVIGRVVGLAQTGRIPYQGLRDLRTQVGEVLAGRRDAGRHDRHVPEALYGALSRDLESHIANVDDGALQQVWETANRVYRQGREQTQEIGRVITDARTPEQVYDGVVRLASDRSGAGVGRLQTLYNALQPETRDALSGTILRGLAQGDPARLPERLASITPNARRILFRDGDATLAGLQDLARHYDRPAFDVAGAAESLGIGQHYRRAMQAAQEAEGTRTALARVIGRGGELSGEQVFDRLAALADGRAGRGGIETLRAAKGAVSPEAWNRVAGTVVSRMGQNPEAVGDTAFSPARFLTAYQGLSTEGRAMLFGGQPQLRQALDDIATISGRFKQLDALANPSGTARNVSGPALAIQAFRDPVTTIGGILGGRIMSSVLAQPATAASAARLSKVYETAVAKPARGTTATLAVASRNFGNVLADKLGVKIDPDAILRALAGQSPAHADEQRDEVPAVRQ